MAPFLIVNPRSGDSTPTADELVAQAEKLGVRCHVLDEGDDPAELAREADADVLAMAGGDGSLGAVAGVAIERDLPFACIPFGTRNHFARDLGLPVDDPLAALGGRELQIDAARVGDRVFLNNLSLGVYAGLVHRRERHRRRSEALARARALWCVAGQRHRLQATVDGESVLARVLLVAVNRYDVSLFTLGERDELDGGEPHLYAADGVLPRNWHERSAPRFRVELETHRAKAAADGEPLVLTSPFEVECLPRALRVLVPA